MLAGRSKLSEPEAGDPQRIVGLHKEHRVLSALGQGEELPPSSRAVWSSARTTIKMMTAPESTEELWCLPYLLAQLPRPGVGLFHFWMPIALGVLQSLGQESLQVEFALETLGGLRERLEHFQSLGEVANGFGVCRALVGALARPLPVSLQPAALRPASV